MTMLEALIDHAEFRGNTLQEFSAWLQRILPQRQP
jgi:hypothetical protein